MDRDGKVFCITLPPLLHAQKEMLRLGLGSGLVVRVRVRVKVRFRVGLVVSADLLSYFAFFMHRRNQLQPTHLIMKSCHLNGTYVHARTHTSRTCLHNPVRG